MSDLEIKKITDRAGTGSPNFTNGVKVSGTDSGLLAPTRTEGETQPDAETASNGDTFYDTANDTYDILTEGAWTRVLGEGGGAASWTVDLSNVTYDSVSYYLNQDNNPIHLAFNPDGTKLYTTDYSADSLFQHSLSTAFDISTASYDSVSFSVSGQDSTPAQIQFNADGTKMFVIGEATDTVYQYSLSTGFDLSTASYDSVSFYFFGQESNGGYGLAFNTDGTKMYICGGYQDMVHQYTLSTGFDLSSASYDSVNLFIGAGLSPTSIIFNPDGTQLLVQTRGYNELYQYSLSTGFDLSTASYDSVSYTTSEATSPFGAVVSTDGTKLFILNNGNDTLYQYSTGL